MDQCIYHKVSGSKIIFLILYIDDILLVSSDLVLLYGVKQFLLKKSFNMKDMGEASYIINIKLKETKKHKIKRDGAQRLLGLPQEIYINKVLEI